jgi:hypothetical protein
MSIEFINSICWGKKCRLASCGSMTIALVLVMYGLSATKTLWDYFWMARPHRRRSTSLQTLPYGYFA